MSSKSAFPGDRSSSMMTVLKDTNFKGLLIPLVIIQRMIDAFSVVVPYSVMWHTSILGML